MISLPIYANGGDGGGAPDPVFLSLDPAEDDGPEVSGGVTYAAEVGDLKARLIPALDTYLASINITNTGGLVWDADGLHIWVNDQSNVRKVLISSGATIATVSGVIATMRGMHRPAGGTTIYTGRGTGAAAFAYTIDMSTAVATSIQLTGATAFARCAVAQAGFLWLQTSPGGGSTLVEYNLSTGAATGRTLGTSVMSVDSFGDGYLYYSENGVSVRRVDVVPVTPSQTAISSFSSFTTLSGAYSSGMRFVTCTGGRIFVDDFGMGYWVELDPTTLAVIGRVLWNDPNLGQASGYSSGQTRQSNNFAINDAGTKVAFQIPDATNDSTFTAARVITLEDGTATWEVPSTSTSRTLGSICVPGDLGNTRGRIAGFAVDHDLRRTILEYKIGSGDWTDFTSGVTFDGTVVIPGGSTLQIRATFAPRFGLPPMAEPFIGSVQATELQKVGVFFL